MPIISLYCEVIHFLLFAITVKTKISDILSNKTEKVYNDFGRWKTIGRPEVALEGLTLEPSVAALDALDVEWSINMLYTVKPTSYSTSEIGTAYDVPTIYT